MSNNRQDELSLHMRIPADKCYLNNALLTLDGICDHFCFTEESRDRMKRALEVALNSSITLSYEKDFGLFDLQFSVYKDKMMIMVEDFFLDENDSGELVEANSHSVRQILGEVADMTDGLSFTDRKGRVACYSMEFNVSSLEENN